MGKKTRRKRLMLWMGEMEASKGVTQRWRKRSKKGAKNKKK